MPTGPHFASPAIVCDQAPVAAYSSQLPVQAVGWMIGRPLCGLLLGAQGARVEQAAARMCRKARVAIIFFAT